MVKTFEEWSAAVDAEASKLRAVQDYLTDDGKFRLKTFETMQSLACFCDTAQDFLDWINDSKMREGLDVEEQQALASRHAAQPLKALLRIAGE